MIKEMCEAVVVEAVRENKEEIIAVAVKGIRRIPKHIPYMAAGAAIALGGVYVYNKIQEKKEEKRNKMKEQMREEIINELNNK